MKKISVIKRDGHREPLDIDKIHKVLEWATDGLPGTSVSDIEMRSHIQLFDGISTEQIHEIITSAAEDLIKQEHNYQFAAARLALFHLRKKVLKQYDPIPLIDLVKRNVARGVYDQELESYYSAAEWERLNSFLDHDRDCRLTSAAVKQIMDKYLVKDRTTGEIFETPQYAFILIAAVIFKNYPHDVRMQYVRDFYDALTRMQISLPTPILAGVRTSTKQFSSCVLIDIDDNLDSIGDGATAIMKYGAKRAGIGVNGGRIRAVKSRIRNGEVSHTGVIHYYRKLESSLKCCCLRPDMYVEILEDQPHKITIDRVVPGMKIKTLQDGNIVYKTVTDKFDTNVNLLDQVKISFDNDTVVNCSINHPFMVLEDSTVKQKLPSELSHKDDVISENGITKLVSISIGQSNDTRYVDITVDGTHTFFTSASPHGEMVLTHNSQGGIRDASMTLFAPVWHLEIEDILVLKNNKGTPDNRVRKIDYGIQWDTYLIRRAVRKQDITLFSPHDVPDLYEAFFGADRKKFEALYEAYEKNPAIRKKTVPGRELLELFLKERQETARIYSFMADHVNTHSPFKLPIYQSNLCLEIALATKPIQNRIDPDAGTVEFDGWVQLCTLAAINLGTLRNLGDLERRMNLLVRALNEILDYQEYPIPQAKTATKLFRPLGIGVINYAYWLAKNGFTYNDPEGHDATHELAEAMYYYALKASVNLARERGTPLPGLEHTIYSDGNLLIDNYCREVDKLVTVGLKLDWDTLRADVKKYGVFNSTLLALMPSESSALISNATNGVEPIRSLVTEKSNKNTSFLAVAPEANKLKNQYDYLWNMTPDHFDGYLKNMAIFQKFVCQSISTNTSYNPDHFADEKIPLQVLMNHFILAAKLGIKTLYYANTKGNEELREDVSALEKSSNEETDQNDCDSCKI
jgi:ribonucleoside-diphosphate reductase alpha subunit